MHQQTPSPSLTSNPNLNPNQNPSWCSEKRHPNSIYPIGSEVEVTHNEDGFRGGWFLATVLNPPPFLLHPSQHFLLHKIFVEYKHLLNRNGSGPLRAFVDLSNVRPKPPPYHTTNHHHHHHNYKESDVVDAFFDDGWWTGVINKVVVFPDKSKQFLVFFDYPPRSMHFSHSDLRLHMFSADGKWFLSSNNSIHLNHNPPQDSNNLVDLTGDDDSDLKDDIFSQVPSEISYFGSSHLVFDNKVSNNLIDLTGLDDSRLHDRDGELNFTSGAHVEVNFDSIDSQDSFDSQDVWVPATFIKRSSHGFFFVKYYCSAECKPVKVIVNSLHIRPKPPPSSRKSFNLLEKVDAFYDSRWLSGVVTKVLPEARYIIYCKSTKNEKEVHHKDVRPHLEWADGMWVPSSSSQDLLPAPNHEKLDQALFSNGYKNVHVSPEPTGIIKDNVGEQTFASSITLKRGTQNVNCDGTMPSNETSVNGDTSIYLMPSNQLKGKTAIDVTHPSKHSTLAMKQPEVPNKKASIDVYSSDTPCNPAKSSEDSDQPSASADNQDNCTKSSSRRKRGRPPRKLKAFAPEAFNETPNEKGVVSPCDVHAEGVLGSTYAGHMIPSPSGSLGQNMNDGKEHSNSYSDHNDKDNEPQRASEVTNLKRQREFGNKKSGFGSDADTVEPATVEPPGIIDFPPSSHLRKSRVMLRYDQMKHPNMQSPTRTFVKHRFKDLNEIFNYKEHKNKALGHTLMSGRQQRHCQQSDSLTQGNAGQCDESGEKQMKGKKQLSDHQALEKAKENKDVETHVLFGCQEDNNNNAFLHRIDETAIKSRNNKELPFVKKSHIWEMIESMEVFKRHPQRPHFGPLYEYKEECREGLAIGNMVTFSTLVDKVSRLKLSDPRSVLDGYLEAAADLERMGFDVGAVRDQLKSLVAIKDRHELTQETYIDIEGHIRDVHKFSKSMINKEISEVDEKIEELVQERSLLEGKKQMKDSAIQLLHAGVDDIKMSLQRAEQEFAHIASSPW